MWPWLRSEHFKNFFILNDRQKFFCKLCLLTCIVHILLLLLVNCSYFGLQKHERFVISAQHNNTVYVLSPLQKQIKLPEKQLGQSSIKSSKVLSYDAYQQLKKSSKQNSKKQQTVVEPIKDKKAQMPAPRPQPLVKNVQKTLTAPKKPQITINEVQVVKKTESLKKDINKKVVPEKKVAPVVAKKNSTAKVENIPVKIPAPLPTKEEKSTEVSKQAVDLKKEIPIKDIAEQQKLSDNLDNAKQDHVILEDIAIDDVTFIGYEQLDSLAVQNKIQQIVEQNFKSPIGIKKGVSCELSVFIDDSGKSKTITVIRSSGILAYDMSARAMLYTIPFPKEVWNKTITIVLGQ